MTNTSEGNGSATSTRYALGIGVGHQNTQGEWLDVMYPQPILHPTVQMTSALQKAGLNEGVTAGNTELWTSLAREFGDDCGTLAALCETLANQTHEDAPTVVCWLATDTQISSVPEAYLKLHLLSHRLVVPNQQNLDGIFANLPNVAWTNEGPIDLADLPQRRLQARLAGRELHLTGVDKFPRMTDYVVPAGVRIADASRVRLGAYVGEGTTVMHEGQINFNAAALGPNMIEGRISQGVTIGSGTDLGGSASTMGTLAGGGKIIVTVGENCLIGANAGTGIPLGDRCTIEAGLYITAGTPIEVVDETGSAVKRVKARELAGASDMLFIRNAGTGRVECRTNRAAIELNPALHAHN